MSKQQTILVVIDPTSEDQPALTKAAEFASHTGADLALFICIFDFDIAHMQWVTGRNLEHLRDSAIDTQFTVLEKLAEPLRSAGRSVSIKVAWDSPLHEAIVREALRIDAAFVVKDTHHHSVLSRSLFTNTDWHLIRECPCPLWLVKPVPVPNQATVMAAIDPVYEHDETAALDRQIISTAQLFSVMFEERLNLVHVFDPPSIPVNNAFATADLGEWDEDVIGKAREVHLQALHSLAADFGFPAEQVQFCEGNHEKLLPAAASDLNADIVVMGAISRSRLQRAMVGHTAEKTLELLPCSVVIVKPDDFKSPLESIPPIYGSVEKTG